MKLTKTVGALGAVVLMAAATLFAAAPAHAETIVGEATFYGESDFGVEAGGYPAGVDWFFGDVSGTGGPSSFGPAGLFINDGSSASGDVQILNQNVTTPETGGSLIDILFDAEVYADAANWWYQLAFFAEEGETGFTMLRPTTTGVVDDFANWVTSGPIAPTPTFPAGYAAGATDNLGNLLTAIYEGTDPTLLAYGLFIGAGDSVTVTGLTFDDTVSLFSPVPTRTVTPNPVSPEAFSTPGQGVTFSGTGWLPGSDVYVYASTGGDAPALIELTNGEYAADENGTFSITVVLPAPPANGAYELYLDDDGLLWNLDVLPQLTLTVAPQLAATGSEVNPWLVGIAALLALGGAGAVMYARRTAVKA